FKMTEHHLGDAGLPPQDVSRTERSRGWRMVGFGAVLVSVLGLLMYSGVISVSVTGLAQIFGTAMIALAFVFFGYILLLAKLAPEERRRVGVIAIFFLCAAIFWAGFEQQATTFNLFALDFTDRSWLGGLFPEGVH